MLLLKALALAASVSAFLVVPDFSKPKDKKEDDTLSILPVDTNVGPDIATMSYETSFDIPCGSCGGLDAHFKVTLAIEDKKVTLNGIDAWPTRDSRQGDTTATFKAVGMEYTEKIQYMTNYSEDKITGLKLLGFKIFRVGDTNPVQDIPMFFISLFETTPEHDLAILGSIQVENPAHPKHSKDKPKKGDKGHKEHKEHKGMQMHHHHKGDKDKEEKNKQQYDPGCESSKCYFEQSVDQCWAEVGCWLKGHKCTHDDDNKSPNPNAGPHQDTDSFFQLPKAVILFFFFIVLVSILSIIGFAVMLSPLIGIVYVVWRCERKHQLAKFGHSNKAADVEAEEGEKSGLLADEDEYGDAPPQYVLAEQTDSESESESEYEEDARKE